MSKTWSGKEVIHILIREFGFEIAGQKGSHVKLRKRIGDKTQTTVIPLHTELATGTLRSALKLADITLDDFKNAT